MSQLPKIPKQHELEEKSRLAFDNHVFRHWQVRRDTPDRGVDATIELKLIDGVATPRATNLRASVQLKASFAASLNVDGSATSSDYTPRRLLSIANDPMALLVHWSEDSDEFHYSWARDEIRRLDLERPAWREQKTLSVRHAHLLDERALELVSQRIAQRHGLHQKIDDVLAAAGQTDEPVRFEVLAGDLVTTAAAAAFLRDYGSRLATQGLLEPVARAAALVEGTRIAQSPGVLVALGYLAAAQGKPFQALGVLGELVLIPDLPKEVEHSCAVLRVSLGFETGRISLDAAHEEIEALLDPGNPADVVQLLQWRLLDGESPNRDEDLRSLRTAVDRLAHRPGAFSRLVGRLVLAREAAFDELNGISQLSMELMLWLKHIELMAPNGSPSVELQRENVARTRFLRASEARQSRLSQARSELTRVIADAERQASPRVSLEASLVKLRVTLAMVRHTMFPWDPSRPTDLTEARRIAELLAEEASRLAEAHGPTASIELRLRLELCSVEAAMLAGRDSGARIVRIRKRAMSLGLDRVEHEAARLLTQPVGEPTMGAQTPESERLALAEMSDTSVERLAKSIQCLHELDESAIQYLEGELLMDRVVAQRELQWCRHLELLVERRGARNPALRYSQPVLGRLRCQKLGHASAHASADGCTLSRQFEASWCAGCEHRAPADR